MRAMKRVMAGGAAVATGLVLVPSAPASAAGGRCDGQQVRTCVSVVKDGHYVRAKSSVRDMKGWPNFSVRTTQVRLQVRAGGRWHTVTNARDWDGWHAVKDKGRSKWAVFDCTGSVRVRAKAHFDWKRAGTDGEWMTSKPVKVPCV